MAEPFKNLLNADLVRTAGQHLRRVWPAFDRLRFERIAFAGLQALELKASPTEEQRAFVSRLFAAFAALKPMPKSADPPISDGQVSDTRPITADGSAPSAPEQARSAESPGAWLLSPDGVAAKGRDLGLALGPEESEHAYKARLLVATARRKLTAKAS